MRGSATKPDSASQVDEIISLALDTTVRTMRALAADWNTKNTVLHLPSEILALCWTFLPLSDRISASHVSQSWRMVALQHPAVWAGIDISAQFRNPLSLLTMALDRSGLHPVDLEYPVETDDARLEIAGTFACNLHRMRAIEWTSSDTLILDQPMPLLEFLSSHTVSISARVMTGPQDRLHTLHVPFHCLPALRLGPMPSVKDFAASVGDDSSTRVVLPLIFHLFPRLERLALLGLQHALIKVPTDPPPPSLARLRLAGQRACADDLVRQYLAWKTAQLTEVELLCACYISGEALSPFFADAVEMSIGPWKGHRADAVARDSPGRTLVFVLDVWAVPDIASTRMAHGIRGLIANSYSVLSSLMLAAEEVYALCQWQGRPLTAVHTLVMTLNKMHRGASAVRKSSAGNDPSAPDALTQHARCYYPWQWLRVLRYLPSQFPALSAFSLHMYSCNETDTGSADDARELLAYLTDYQVPGLPVLHVRGFGADVVSNLDQRSVQQLPMKVEFEASPND